MKRILLVDDDPIVLGIYRDRLARQGFEVQTATDGLAAMKALRLSKPDVAVLDLMLPKLSGVDVLKFMRGQPDLATVPVIVLSNAYMDQLAQEAAQLGAEKGLLKVKCNPGLLFEAVNDVLEGRSGRQNTDQLLAASAGSPSPPAGQQAPARTTASNLWAPEPAPAAGRSPGARPYGAKPSGPQPAGPADHDFVTDAHAISRNLRELFEAFQNAPTDKDRELRLQDFYRKVHFIAAMAGMAEYHLIAQMASALEALLFGMMDKLPQINASLLRTTTTAVQFLEELFQHAPGLRGRIAPRCSVLVVDDDRLSNRLVITALRNAQLQARGTDSSETALRMLQETHFDLVLLDIEMPGLDGIELCKRLRGLPGYDKTPVIYVTLHADPETAAKTAASGGNDLIPKPILPAELAVKVVMHSLKSQLAKPTPS